MMKKLLIFCALALVSCAGHKENEIVLNSEEDLAGLRVAVATGSSYEMDLSSREDIQLLRFNTESDLLQALSNDRADVVVIDEVVFNPVIQRENGIKIAILDVSAACHMPDVLEMPYRPPLKDSFEAEEKPYTYRLAGNTCLAGDVIGDYSFEAPLQVGSRLYFTDMAMYTMVKNNTFNGMPLPSIWVLDDDGSCTLFKDFGYEDFKMRL